MSEVSFLLFPLASAVVLAVGSAVGSAGLLPVLFFCAFFIFPGFLVVWSLVTVWIGDGVGLNY